MIDVPGIDPEYSAFIQEREGVRFQVYIDTTGHATGGIGHLMLDRDGQSYAGMPIAPEKVVEWAQYDMGRTWDAAAKQMKAAGIDPRNKEFHIVLGSVNYQLGTGWTQNHPITWSYIVAGDYKAAAYEISNSTFARIAPRRAKEFADALIALESGSKFSHPIFPYILAILAILAAIAAITT